MEIPTSGRSPVLECMVKDEHAVMDVKRRGNKRGIGEVYIAEPRTVNDSFLGWEICTMRKESS